MWLVKTRIQKGGSTPLYPPASCISNFNSKPETKRQEAPTCEGLNLSSPRAARADLSLPPGQREIGVLPVSSKSETLRWQVLQRQADEIKAKYGVKPCK